MKTKSAEIKYFKKDSFSSYAYKDLKHVKVLPYLSIVQSVEGSYDIALGNKDFTSTGERGFFVAPAGIKQTIIHRPKQSGVMTCRWLFIDVEINKIHKLDSFYEFPLILGDKEKVQMNELFDALFSSDDIWENYSCCYKILGLLMSLSSRAEKKENSGVRRAVDYMTENFTKQISISELSKVANMSESNFYAAFKKLFGSSPIAYLNHYRLSLAVNLLLETDSTVSEISYSVGIKDSMYFCKLFKKSYGMTPKEYRANKKAR